MANFNFETSIPTTFNFYFGTVYTGIETDFDFSTNGYGRGIYDFEFGLGPKQLVIKSTATLGYIINSINVENINGEDILYVNTISGIVREFSLTCTGIVDNRNVNVVDSDFDYESESCGHEVIWEGIDDKVIKLDTASGVVDSFLLDGNVSCLLYYVY